MPADGLSGNIGDGRASGVLAQFVPTAGRDGHFVVFNDAKAKGQAATFLANLAADPKGRVRRCNERLKDAVIATPGYRAPADVCL